MCPNLGAWINHNFFGVNSKDLTDYKKLQLCGFWMCFLGFLILPLIPLQSQIERFKKERDVEELE